ncbi:MAG: hypothetical protein AAGD07_00720 [Planctomycetota bacterium]
MSTTTQEPGFFRCPVPLEQSQGALVIGRSRFTIEVAEASIDGFTVIIPACSAHRVRLGQPWVLRHDGAKLEVHPQWFFNDPEGHVQVGLRRLRDLTPQPSIGGWFPKFSSGRRIDESSPTPLVFTGSVLILLLALELPGLGDALGTSGRVQAGLVWVGEGISNYLLP